jgi:S-adenosylmethionine hydrolase
MKNTRGRDFEESGSRVSSSAAQQRDHSAIITLLTDFGNADYFVGAMKGAILSVNAQATIVDVTHEIPAHDIQAAAFTLLGEYSTFPAGTIHVAVVDPGVGSKRRPILIVSKQHRFVGPDNGIFSYVCDQLSDYKVFHLTNINYFRLPVSCTFNGRDVFAPVAGALSKNVSPEELGEPVVDLVRLKELKPTMSADGTIVGRIIHLDRFGNCVTNITRRELTPGLMEGGAYLKVKGRLVKSFRNYFAQSVDSGEKVFGIWGSAGFLELAANGSSAARSLGVERGDVVMVMRDKSKNTGEGCR